MIQIENELFTIIATALRAAYDGIYVTGDYVNQPPKMPAVFIIEQDNSVYQRGVDSGNTENYANVMYQVDVYSNKDIGSKAECKEIIGAVDEQFNRLGFIRTYMNPVPNMNNATIYRMTARYRGVVSKDHYIYGR